MNTLVVFQYDTSGTIQYITPETSLQGLDKSPKIILETALIHTLSAIKEDSHSFYNSLINRRIQMRITDDMTGTTSLLPHDIILTPPCSSRKNDALSIAIGCLSALLNVLFTTYAILNCISHRFACTACSFIRPTKKSSNQPSRKYKHIGLSSMSRIGLIRFSRSISSFFWTVFGRLLAKVQPHKQLSRQAEGQNHEFDQRSKKH